MDSKIKLHSIQRINVVGTSGCGKSTFSKKLAAITGYPYMEIDQIFWEPNWRVPDDNIFFGKLELALEKDTWVLDGNFTRTIPIKWKNVQMVIWLDYSFFRIVSRVIIRSIRRAITRKELWEGTGNKESFKKLFSKESIVLWSINHYKSNKVQYDIMMSDKKYSHIRFVRLSSPGAAQKFLSSVDN